MKAKRQPFWKISIYLSMSSFVLFIVFYIFAAIEFPGGTYANPRQKGFSIAENYLCDLLDDFTYLLQDNPAKIYARVALGFLCLGIFLFWYHLPFLFRTKTNPQNVMRFSGMLAMFVCVFLTARNHDIITWVAGILGSVAMILSFKELFKSGYKGYMVFGIICLLLILLNYYIYESGTWRNALPVVQKVTTLAGMAWFVVLNIKLLTQLELEK